MAVLALVVVTACISLVVGQQSWGTPQSGAIVLTRNGLYSSTYNSGRVVMYGVGSPTSTRRFWGNICRLPSFGLNEAHVICHQLAFTGATSWLYTSVDSFGVDNRAALLSSVSCSSNKFLTLFQCSVSTTIVSSCTDSDDVSVICYNVRVWDNPSSGQIRLTRGNFTNEGLLEVYCNGAWGTVCDDTFGATAASVVCKELGYSQYTGLNTLTLLGTGSIWLNSLSCSSSSTSCLNSCQRCPSTGTTACAHVEDVTIKCYSSSIFSTNTNTNTTCPISSTSDNESGGLSGGAITGIAIGSLFGVGIIIGILIHIDRDKKRRAAAQHAAAANAAQQTVQLTNVTPAQPAPSQEPQSVPPPPPSFESAAGTYPVQKEETKVPPKDYPSYPATGATAPLRTEEPPAYPASGFYPPPPPSNPDYPPPPSNPAGYPPPTNPGYPPPTNPGYPPTAYPSYPPTAAYPPNPQGYPTTAPYPPEATSYGQPDPPNNNDHTTQDQPPPYFNPAYPPGHY